MSQTVVESALAHRREVFAAISAANGRQDAVETISRALAISAEEAEQVLSAPLGEFIGHTTEHPVHAGPSGFALFPFRDEEQHSELYATRAADPKSATRGEWDPTTTESERSAGLKRIEAETAMWFVAVDTSRDELVGLVFGEQLADGGDIDVAIWVTPEERKKGYGLSALRESRRALASYFPGAHLVVRAPLPASK